MNPIGDSIEELSTVTAETNRYVHKSLVESVEMKHGVTVCYQLKPNWYDKPSSAHFVHRFLVTTNASPETQNNLPAH